MKAPAKQVRVPHRRPDLQPLRPAAGRSEPARPNRAQGDAFDTGGPARPGALLSSQAVLQLQSIAGNRSVASLIAAQRDETWAISRLHHTKRPSSTCVLSHLQCRQTCFSKSRPSRSRDSRRSLRVGVVTSDRVPFGYTAARSIVERRLKDAEGVDDDSFDVDSSTIIGIAAGIALGTFVPVTAQLLVVKIAAKPRWKSPKPRSRVLVAP